jgi:hypothetical protein
MGFGAIVAGREAAVGETWEWRGDLLNIQDCGDLVATFKLESITDVEGERCAHVTGTMSNWPEGYAPEFRCEVDFSLPRGLPVRSKFTLHSRARTEVVTTRITSYEPPPAEPATKEGDAKK